ncbi:MAG: regulatory protein RecX [Lachnospiraceae bacterium]|nr:regulatory protein RecX [Lachnospiraceae bacterium]
MRVTEITEVSKSRMRISTDEGLTFVLYRGELRRFRIRQGEEIEEEALRAVLEEILPKRAKLRAMNLLKNRDYTVRQLGDKLREGGYPEEIIGEALDYVQGFRYTDDLRYAENFIRCHIQDRSRRRIESDLLGRGIDRDTLESAWAGFEAEGGCQDEQAMIQALLAKKGFDRGTAQPKERQRMYGYLMRKGFDCEQVRKALLSEDW